MSPVLDIPLTGHEPRRDGCDSLRAEPRLANELLLEIFEHIVPGALFTEDECRKMYLALTQASRFFASIATPCLFRRVTYDARRRPRDYASVWIRLVDAGDPAALAVAQHVVVMEVGPIASAVRSLLFRAMLRMPHLKTLMLSIIEMTHDMADTITRLEGLASLQLRLCTIDEDIIPHLRPLRAQELVFSKPPAPMDVPWERALGRLANAETLHVLRVTAAALPTRFLQGIVFRVLETADIALLGHSAELQQAVCTFLASVPTLKVLRLFDPFGARWELSVPANALPYLTRIEAPLRVIVQLAAGRAIQVLVMSAQSTTTPEDLELLRLPKFRETLARVETLGANDDLLLRGEVLPYALKLKTLRVRTSRTDFDQTILELASELTRATGTLRTLTINSTYSHDDFSCNLSLQHDIVQQCTRSVPSLSEISIGRVFRWDHEIYGHVGDVIEPALRSWKPRVVDKDALTKMVTSWRAREHVTDFDGFLRNLYTDELAIGALNLWQAGFV